jgi:hypothetical protein
MGEVVTQFHEAISRAVHRDDAAFGHSPGRDEVCDVVLDMPEMQAIKSALRTAAQDVVDSYHNWPDLRSTLEGSLFRLPESVIEWVMDGPR